MIFILFLWINNKESVIFISKEVKFFRFKNA